MKYSECNERQKKAFRNIKFAADWIIGGLENTLLDEPEDSEEYKSAKAQLDDHEALVDEIYNAAITDIYEEGSVAFGGNAERTLRDIRFCGKEWLMERVEARVRKCGH